jgi:hypothetical protein
MSMAFSYIVAAGRLAADADANMQIHSLPRQGIAPGEQLRADCGAILRVIAFLRVFMLE